MYLKVRGGKIVGNPFVVPDRRGRRCSFSPRRSSGFPDARDDAIITDAGRPPVQPRSCSQRSDEGDQGIRSRPRSPRGSSPSSATPSRRRSRRGRSRASAAPGIGLGGGFRRRPAPAACSSLASESAVRRTPATYLGLSADQIPNSSGQQHLAQIATTQGKTADGLVPGDLLDRARSNPASSSRAGKLTADRRRRWRGLQTTITRPRRTVPPEPAAGPLRQSIQPPRAASARARHRPFGADLNAAAAYSASQPTRSRRSCRAGQTLAQIGDRGKAAAAASSRPMLGAQRSNLEQARRPPSRLHRRREQTMRKGLTAMITNIVDGTRPRRAVRPAAGFEAAGFGFRRGGGGQGSFGGLPALPRPPD